MKTFKWIAIILVSILTLIIVAGICFKLFSTKPIPPGKLVNVNGTMLHIRVQGKKNDLPTIIIEGGAGCDTDLYHWIANGLKNGLRVIRYDREGIGYSELSENNLTPEYYANQLHKLLEESGENPPYILAGHSLGGAYSRIFRDLYPSEIEGLVFLDSSHPEQLERYEEIGEKRPDKGNTLLECYSTLGDMGILGLLNKVVNLRPSNKDLPESIKSRSSDRFYSGKKFRGSLKEMNFIENLFLRTNKFVSLDSLPVLVFTASEKYSKPLKESLEKRNIDPDKRQEVWFTMQQELKELSSKGKKIDINGNHMSIVVKKENAEIINNEILLMAKSITLRK